MIPLYIQGLGMVTASGLNQGQSTASFLGSVDGFAEALCPGGQGEMQVMARVPANWRLRSSASEWLMNLAARAGREAMQQAYADAANTVLICCAPEEERCHPCWRDITPVAFLNVLERKLGGPFAKGGRLVQGGAASLVALLPKIANACAKGAVDKVLLIGVDSLVNATDIARLRLGERLLGQSAQGLVPGEGAGALVMSVAPQAGMAVRSVGLGTEDYTVLSERQSQGAGMLNALKAACQVPGCDESDIEFIVSNMNGERYAGLEMLLFRARFYRTYRESLPTAYPAMSFGETGTASGALALAVAADAFRNNQTPGKHAMLEIASEDGLRAGAFLSHVV